MHRNVARMTKYYSANLPELL